MIYQNTSITTADKFTFDTSIHRSGVLVVDHQDSQRTQTVDLLKHIGVDNVFEAQTGEMALDIIRLRTEKPAVLLIDLNLPGIDGIEVLQILAAEEIRPAIIIASKVDDILKSSIVAMIEALNFILLGALNGPNDESEMSEALLNLSLLTSKLQETKSSSYELKPEVLQHAIFNGEIRPAYQPKINLQQGSLAGVEALARWYNLKGIEGSFGNSYHISPNLFIPMAEQADMIIDLTMSIIDQVLADMAYWRTLGMEVPVAINLSALSLADRHLASNIIGLVNKYEIPPALITFEITESAFIVDLAEALANTTRLCLKGFSFSIDDYGTGFSSMQQLARFPFNELKIDRSFVHGSARKKHLRSILQSAIDTGRRLGMRTVAEGVETEGELRLLKNMGCRYGQGFLFARPMSQDDFVLWNRKKARTIAEFCRSV